jgi:CubicO group peptidase (beta-lactamase class C family)
MPLQLCTSLKSEDSCIETDAYLKHRGGGHLRPAAVGRHSALVGSHEPAHRLPRLRRVLTLGQPSISLAETSTMPPARWVTKSWQAIASVSCYHSAAMKRRTFLQCGLGSLVASPLIAAVQQNSLEAAAAELTKAVTAGQLHAAALYIQKGEGVFARSFGASKSADDIFLLASISKPIAIAALMTLYDKGQFQLDDPVKKFIPQFTKTPRDQITIRQLLTHVSGLPDQLPENNSLRKRHAPLSEFIDLTVRTPLLFDPGTRYSYSSMAILLASEVARRISGAEFPKLVDETIFKPLGMKRSALGLGRFKLEDTIRCQVERAAPESGGGDLTAKDWDWNSPYWRNLASPWGGAHASAPDVARFLAEFLHPAGKALMPESARLIVRNHNPQGITPHGLGFAIGQRAGSPGCSEKTFGHSGATGTLTWADPANDTICVVLTTLPLRAATPHPAKLASDRVAQEQT